MGKVRKGHNWKARTQKTVTIDKDEQNKILVDGTTDIKEQYDDSNALVLPSQKRKTKIKGDAPAPVKPLSKKEKKRLQKILEVKEKKQKRTRLLEALQSVQVSAEELSNYQSTTQLHSQTYKRHLTSTPESSGAINSLTGSNKRRKIESVKDSKVVLQNESSESETDESESENGESESDSDTAEDEEMETNEEQVEVSCPAEKTPVSSTKKEVKSVVSVPEKSDTTKKQPLKEVVAQPVTHVPVIRDQQIQNDRLKLPILGEEQAIMEMINENPITILCGETGSGKTTQVPQFLYEAGYATGGAMIAVTEPRRVAAISMSQRVAHEMSLTSKEVSYQIRYEGNVTPDTRIKFLTDGVLLKEVQNDFLLSRYSVVIIDEAHERSMYTDILIGLLSRIVPLRHKKGKPLKMVIMSATLRVEDFTANNNLFKTPPPVLKVESRQFPVTIHFNKVTHEDYMSEAFRKVCKIHKELPEGGILVFVTGQQEVHTLCAKLNRMYPYNPQKQVKSGKGKSKRSRNDSEAEVESLPKVSLDDYSVTPEDEQAEVADKPDHDTDDEDDLLLDGRLDDTEDLETSHITKAYSSSQPIYTLPLYSLLSTKRQQLVFKPPPEGSRLCVVATNVAETSITIPGIKYVVDTGKTKTKYFDKVTGVSMFKVTWTSKASANQRAGRAGRTSAGHSYRLYSSAVFENDFELFSLPEIVRRPVEDLVLQMKAMYIDRVTNFPYPTPPSEESLQAAEQLLIHLGALEVSKKSKTKTAQVTSLGKTMAAFPVSPRYGKMLSISERGGILPYVIALVSALSVQELLVSPEGSSTATEEDDDYEQQRKEKQRSMQKMRLKWAGLGESLELGDLSVLLRAVGACEFAGGSEAFCQQHAIRYKAMCEVRKLRKQLTDTVNLVMPDSQLAVNPKLKPPTELQCKLLRQVVLAGMADHVAMKLPAGLLDKEGKKITLAYRSTSTDDIVYIHRNSVLHKHQPQFVVYQQMEQLESAKLCMKGVSSIELSWLPLFCPSYCMMSSPLEEPKPSYDLESGRIMCHMTSTYGPHSWPVPAVELAHPYTVDCFKHFGMLLLQGEVCRQLQKYSKSLLSLPSTMTKSWAKLQPRTETLLKALTNENVYSRDTLKQAWDKDAKCLLSAYKEWLPEVLHSQIDSLWPPKL